MIRGARCRCFFLNFVHFEVATAFDMLKKHSANSYVACTARDKVINSTKKQDCISGWKHDFVCKVYKNKMAFSFALTKTWNML